MEIVAIRFNFINITNIKLIVKVITVYSLTMHKLFDDELR